MTGLSGRERLALLLACAPLWLFALLAIAHHAPAIGQTLFCGERLDECTHPNRWRNALEVGSFAATTILLPVGLITLLFTNGQLREAANTRNATIYLQITGLWSEDRAVKSRALLTGLDDAYGSPANGLKALYPDSGTYIRATIARLEQTDRPAANEMTYILQVLENIGVLCAENYVSYHVVVAFVGASIVWQMGLLARYLAEIRDTQPGAYAYADALYRAAQKAGV